ncbi:MAG TPA: hypothetical protein VKS79_24325 [Gemmataceae bacterium]|nr:hypothetical protein [Gemmataceae bacterium]
MRQSYINGVNTKKDKMATKVTATVVGGMFKPDEALQLAEQTRVKLTVEPLAEKSASAVGWEAFRAWIRQNSVHGLGRRLTRDELHERR